MNIQILQGMVHAGEGRLDSGKEKTAESSPSGSNVKDNAFSGISNVSKKQIDLIEFSYPPFFPLGDTQGIYSVLSHPKPSSPSSDYLKAQGVALKKHGTTHTKMFAEQKQHNAALDKNTSSRNTVPDVKNSFTPGSFLDLKV